MAFNSQPFVVSSALRAFVTLVTVSFCTAATVADSVWIGPGGGSWLDPLRWDGPVPNMPGDVAHLERRPPGTVFITVPSTVTVGQVHLVGPSAFVLSGLGALIFDNPGPDPAVLRAQGAAQTHVLGIPVGIVDGEQLEVDVIAGAQLVLTGGLAPGFGDVIKVNQGVLQLNGPSPNWSGALTIDSGEVVIGASTALGTGSGTAADGTRINAGAVLRFNVGSSVNNELFQLDGGTLFDRSFGVRGNTFGPIELLSGSTIAQFIQGGSTFSPTVLEGDISGPGDLTLSGHFTLAGDNAYTGVTNIASPSNGIVLVTSVSGLGDVEAGTIINANNQLILEVSAAEPLHVKGGRVSWRNNSDNWTAPVRIDSGFLHLGSSPQSLNFPITLGDGPASIIANANAPPTWAGVVDGAGDLIIGSRIVFNGNIAHHGSLTLNSATLNTANNYTGDTRLGQGVTTVNHSLAFGTSNTPIVINAPTASLILNKTVGRDITLLNGSVTFVDELESYSEELRARQGSISFSGASFEGTLVLDNDQLPLEITLTGGTMNGTITGHGKLALHSPASGLKMNGDNDYRGVTVVFGNPVELNSSTTLGSAIDGTVIAHGSTTLNSVTDERFLLQGSGRLGLTVQLSELPRFGRRRGSSRLEILDESEYDQQVDIREGTLEVRAATKLGKVIIHDRGALVVEQGRSLQLADDHVEMRGGTLDGSITGLKSLKKVSHAEATVRNLRDFSGQIELAAGTLTIAASLTESKPAGQGNQVRSEIHVTRADGTVLRGSGGHGVDADVYLNNARGVRDGGALGSISLLGDLYLGDEGALLPSGSTVVTLHGAVFGGNLVFPDIESGGTVVITSNRAAYTGETITRQGTLELANGGRLAHSSRIVVGSKGRLHLNNHTSHIAGIHSIADNDRIADDVPVHLNGGELRFWTPSSAAVRENIGLVLLERGSSEIAATPAAFGPSDGTTTLTIGTLERHAGATLYVDLEAPLTVTFEAEPVLQHEIFGGWATVAHRHAGHHRIDFAAYGPTGVQALANHHVNLSTATVEHNVLVSQHADLPLGSTLINSLTMRGEDQIDLNLRRQRLTIESGGIILSGQITNGEIAPGASRELILTSNSGFSTGAIHADIVDSDSGPSSLTLSPGRFTTDFNFYGDNSYTGPTQVNDGVTARFHRFNSLPNGSDLKVNGGIVQLGFESGAPKPLGALILRDQGQLAQRYPGQAKLDFDSIEVESGTIQDVELVGNAPIKKRTDGTATISTRSVDFAGSIDIHEGTLIVAGSESIGTADINVHGGRVVLQTARNDSNLVPSVINLHGGDLVLDNTHRGVIHVNAPARITGTSFSNFSRLPQLGQLIGSQHVTLDGRVDMVVAIPDFSGDFLVEGSVVARHANGFGRGSVTLAAGGSLELSIENSESIPNELVLDGGQLTTDLEQNIVPTPGRIAGPVVVISDSTIATSYFDSLEITGSLEIRDDVRLNKENEGSLIISGDLRVGSNTQFLLGPGFRRQTDNTGVHDLFSEVHLTGTIKSMSENSSIDFQRSGFDYLNFSASMHVQQGHSMQVFQDGVPITMTFASDAALTGNGTFLNPVTISGGVLDPGQSPGRLTFADTLTIGAGTIYEWEINEAAGEAGQPKGWDFIAVADQLGIEATADNPMIIRLSGLNTIDQPGRIANFDPDSEHRWLIASAASISGFDPAAVRVNVNEAFHFNPTFRERNFSVEQSGGDLFLVYRYVVPEPSSLALLLLGSMSLLRSPRRYRRLTH